MDINNIIKKKTKGLIKYINANKKLFDEIMLNAASLSFYTITSLSSLIIIVSFIIDSFNDNFKVTIIKDLVEISYYDDYPFYYPIILYYINIKTLKYIYAI